MSLFAPIARSAHAGAKIALRVAAKVGGCCRAEAHRGSAWFVV